MKSGTAPLRAWVGISVAALLCLNLSLDFSSSAIAFYGQNQDPAALAKQERRFARLRAELPAGSVMGYYSDSTAKGHGSAAVFYTVLFTVAPHLVVPEGARQKPALVLGNFSRPPDLNQLQQERGLKLVKDFGGGVMLFRREGS